MCIYIYPTGLRHSADPDVGIEFVVDSEEVQIPQCYRLSSIL